MWSAGSSLLTGEPAPDRLRNSPVCPGSALHTLRTAARRMPMCRWLIGVTAGALLPALVAAHPTVPPGPPVLVAVVPVPPVPPPPPPIRYEYRTVTQFRTE